MLPKAPLPLHHSWPLFGAARCFGIAASESSGAGTADPEDASHAIAKALIYGNHPWWACDLTSEELTWSCPVHDLFGIPREERPSRQWALERYSAYSRQTMQQLRMHALRFRRGFTLDVQISRSDGDARWMRLSAMPVLRDGHPAYLVGTKVDVTARYASQNGPVG